jgi:hypothetical protein
VLPGPTRSEAIVSPLAAATNGAATRCEGGILRGLLKSVLIVNLLRCDSFLFGGSKGFHPLNLQKTSLSLPHSHTTFISSHIGVILIPFL